MSKRFQPPRSARSETDCRTRSHLGTKTSSPGSINTQRTDLPPDLPWSIQTVAPGRLKKATRNARIHPKKTDQTARQ
jgi:hypothetical protein